MAADTSELQPDWDLTPAQSPVFFGVPAVLLLGVLLAALPLWRRARARYRQARDSVSPDALLAPGVRVVEGVVEYDRGAELAVRVEVEQLGQESESSGTWSHSWTEVGRAVTVRPFLLKHASGQRIRVEPTQDVQLIDEMDGLVLVDLSHRKRVAELVPGEHVFAEGLLSLETVSHEAGGYRGGRGLVLRAPPHARLLLSSEPMGARFQRQARVHAVHGWVAAGLLLLLPVVNFDYVALAALGKVGEATITSLTVKESEDSDGNKTRTGYATLEAPALRVKRKEQVSGPGYDKLKALQRAPIRYVPGVPWLAELGPDPTASGFRTLAFWLASIALLIVYRLKVVRSRAWYDFKVVNTGAGTLQEYWEQERVRGAGRS
jgi:hypothetical protein